MTRLQTLNCRQDLPDLVGLGFTLARLNIDPRVSESGRLVDAMTCPALARLAEEVITNPAQISEPNSFRILTHRSKNVVHLRHAAMIPLMMQNIVGVERGSLCVEPRFGSRAQIEHRARPEFRTPKRRRPAGQAGLRVIEKKCKSYSAAPTPAFPCRPSTVASPMPSTPANCCRLAKSPLASR